MAPTNIQNSLDRMLSSSSLPDSSFLNAITAAVPCIITNSNVAKAYSPTNRRSRATAVEKDGILFFLVPKEVCEQER